MAFFTKSKKPELKEEMRMRYSAPSFSFIRGECYYFWGLEDIKKDIQHIRDSVAVIHPGVNMILYPRQWMKVLSCCSYIVICSKGRDEEVLMLKREAEKIIYSLNAQTLCGVSICSSPEEASVILDSVLGETHKKVITINNTEGDLEC